MAPWGCCPARLPALYSPYIWWYAHGMKSCESKLVTPCLAVIAVRPNTFRLSTHCSRTVLRSPVQSGVSLSAGKPFLWRGGLAWWWYVSSSSCCDVDDAGTFSSLSFSREYHWLPSMAYVNGMTRGHVQSRLAHCRWCPCFPSAYNMQPVLVHLPHPWWSVNRTAKQRPSSTIACCYSAARPPPHSRPRALPHQPAPPPHIQVPHSFGDTTPAAMTAGSWAGPTIPCCGLGGRRHAPTPKPANPISIITVAMRPATSAAVRAAGHTMDTSALEHKAAAAASTNTQDLAMTSSALSKASDDRHPSSLCRAARRMGQVTSSTGFGAGVPKVTVCHAPTRLHWMQDWTRARRTCNGWAGTCHH